MLSILIPIYNFDVRAFVKQLSDQAQQLSVETEIICLDDLSEPAFKKLNADLSTIPLVKYIESETNLGRSAVRNKLAELSSYEHLLYLDCDGECVNDDYLQQYIAQIQDYDVIYGGRIYQEFRPVDDNLHFHWYCGTAREEILVEVRSANPYKTFMTNNFLIRKAVYDQVKMDESIVGYGHEDTFFAIELKAKGFKIKHIDNPIKHIGIETTEVFLEKSENGVKNLAFLMHEQKVDDSIKLVRYYHLATKFALMPLVRAFIKFRLTAIKQNFHSSTPNLLWFDLWKLVKLDEYLKA
jgi:glycosyltransferase involved in cell wall biosynthesis